MTILLTGGLGYIGSHTAVELIEAGFDVVIADNLSNSKSSVLDHLANVTGRVIPFYEIDVSDSAALIKLCNTEEVEAIIHFAGLKAVGESVAQPLRYYHANISSAVSVCEAMLACDVANLVFSSSATVYGEPEKIPLDENCRADTAANPYGTTKIMIEKILNDFSTAHPEHGIALLRYFNPAGAHKSGELGEDPKGIPNNLVPFLTQVAIGMHEQLTVNGDDYPTPDGTCIRDYIHVSDLARGHIAALERLRQGPGVCTYNLGTGRGRSVREVVAAFEAVIGRELPKQIGPRRAGDVPISYTDPSRAEKELGWRASMTMEDICRDAWQWQQKYPDGYE